jgi:sulfopyruvate decarboxylase TPP-binding subunit
MAGTRGIVLMQTRGFATLANVLASLVVPSQIPLLMMISERGTLGDFQLGQAIVWRTMRTVLETLGIEHHALTRLDDVQFIIDRVIKQAYPTQAAAAMILSPLLTNRG